MSEVGNGIPRNVLDDFHGRVPLEPAGGSAAKAPRSDGSVKVTGSDKRMDAN
jgi:hypothetical protein